LAGITRHNLTIMAALPKTIIGKCDRKALRIALDY